MNGIPSKELLVTTFDSDDDDDGGGNDLTILCHDVNDDIDGADHAMMLLLMATVLMV